MNCLEFLERLDAGDVASLDHDSRLHAKGCAGCRAALESATTLEAALLASFDEPAVPASPEFVDRLMARVERTPQARPLPLEIARSTVAAFASPPIAAAAAGAVVLLGVAAAFGFDPRRVTEAVIATTAPAARMTETLLAPLPATGLAHDLVVGGLLCAALPLLAVLLAGAYQLGNLIGERAPRAL